MHVCVRTKALTSAAARAGDLTAYAMAHRIGVRQSTISRILAGRTVPSLPTIGALALAYGLKLDDLVEYQTAASPT